MKPTPEAQSAEFTNWSLLVPYLAPYFVYVAVASVSAQRIPPEISYPIRLIAVPLLLVWAWKWYAPLRGPRSPVGSVLTGALGGLLGLVVWVALVTPLAPGDNEPWPLDAFLLRVAASVLVVPLFEELFTRAYVFRVAYQWGEARRAGESHALEVAIHERSLNEVTAGAWNGSAVLVSTVVFAAGHHPHEWPAAIAYGLLMSALWIVRKDLLACVVAHAVTNLALAAYVFVFGRWELW